MIQALINKGRKLRISSENFVWVILGLLLIISAVTSPIFLTGRNLKNIFLIQPVGLGIASLSQALVMISGGIDMSIGSAVSLLTTLAAGFFKSFPEASPASAFLMILVVGLMIGALNGFFVVILKIPAFMGTLATMSILQGVIYFYTKKPIGGIPKSFRYIAEGKILGVPVSFVFFVLVFILVLLFMKKHKGGKLIYAVGSNSYISQISGIAVKRVMFLTYMLGGLLVGLASVFLAARMGGGGPTSGTGYELDTITASVIGGISLSGGVGHPVGIIGGVLTLTIFSNTMNLLDINPYIQMFLKGVILILAVSFNSESKKK
ncbi:MAG: ABC transporter permease [Spirochaetales bacterium]|nr:ABC transporter permease [Spirochaetales bacterium]